MRKPKLREDNTSADSPTACYIFAPIFPASVRKRTHNRREKCFTTGYQGAIPWI